jgi:hypothetical protein
MVLVDVSGYRSLEYCMRLLLVSRVMLDFVNLCIRALVKFGDRCEYLDKLNCTHSMKPRYFKMGDVLYPMRIMRRYLPDTSRYVSEEYRIIKF